MAGKEQSREPVNIEGLVIPEDIKDIKLVNYLRAVRTHLVKNNLREAFAVLQQACVEYPDDPFLLSYFGYLQAVVDKLYRKGVENCMRAIELIKKRALAGGVEYYWFFYLNVGKAYLAAGRKKDAIDAYRKGLQFDKGNRAILKELRTLGVRGKPPISFLDRSHPINKFLGMALHKRKTKRAS